MNDDVFFWTFIASMVIALVLLSLYLLCLFIKTMSITLNDYFPNKRLSRWLDLTYSADLVDPEHELIKIFLSRMELQAKILDLYMPIWRVVKVLPAYLKIDSRAAGALLDKDISQLGEDAALREIREIHKLFNDLNTQVSEPKKRKAKLNGT